MIVEQPQNNDWTPDDDCQLCKMRPRRCALQIAAGAVVEVCESCAQQGLAAASQREAARS